MSDRYVFANILRPMGLWTTRRNNYAAGQGRPFTVT